MKTSPVGDELLNAFGRTDITKHDIPRAPFFLPAFYLHHSHSTSSSATLKVEAGVPIKTLESTKLHGVSPST